MILLRPVGVFVVDMLMEFEGVVVIWGDMRMQLPIRGWNGSMKKETLINTANFTLLKFI